MVSFKIDVSDFEKAAKLLDRLGMNGEKIVTQAIHNALDKAKPEAEAMISARYNVSDVSLTVEKRDMGGDIVASGGMKPATEFSPQPSGGPVGQTVSVEIIRGQRKSILPGGRGPGRGAFMIGDGRVMERRQDSRFPIYPVYTIGIPDMFYYKGISNPIRDKTAEYAMEEVSKKFFEI